jgi:hypothetical protein
MPSIIAAVCTVLIAHTIARDEQRGGNLADLHLCGKILSSMEYASEGATGTGFSQSVRFQSVNWCREMHTRAIKA